MESHSNNEDIFRQAAFDFAESTSCDFGQGWSLQACKNAVVDKCDKKFLSYSNRDTTLFIFLTVWKENLERKSLECPYPTTKRFLKEYPEAKSSSKENIQLLRIWTNWCALVVSVTRETRGLLSQLMRVLPQVLNCQVPLSTHEKILKHEIELRRPANEDNLTPVPEDTSAFENRGGSSDHLTRPTRPRRASRKHDEAGAYAEGNISDNDKKRSCSSPEPVDSRLTKKKTSTKTFPAEIDTDDYPLININLPERTQRGRVIKPTPRFVPGGLKNSLPPKLSDINGDSIEEKQLPSKSPQTQRGPRPRGRHAKSVAITAPIDIRVDTPPQYTPTTSSVVPNITMHGIEMNADDGDPSAPFRRHGDLIRSDLMPTLELPDAHTSTGISFETPDARESNSTSSKLSKLNNGSGSRRRKGDTKEVSKGKSNNKLIRNLETAPQSSSKPIDVVGEFEGVQFMPLDPPTLEKEQSFMMWLSGGNVLSENSMQVTVPVNTSSSAPSEPSSTLECPSQGYMSEAQGRMDPWDNSYPDRSDHFLNRTILLSVPNQEDYKLDLEYLSPPVLTRQGSALGGCISSPNEFESNNRPMYPLFDAFSAYAKPE